MLVSLKAEGYKEEPELEVLGPHLLVGPKWPSYYFLGCGCLLVCSVQLYHLSMASATLETHLLKQFKFRFLKYLGSP